MSKKSDPFYILSYYIDRMDQDFLDTQYLRIRRATLAVLLRVGSLLGGDNLVQLYCTGTILPFAFVTTIIVAPSLLLADTKQMVLPIVSPLFASIVALAVGCSRYKLVECPLGLVPFKFRVLDLL